MEVKHKNVVRFLGYCADTQGRTVDFEGSFVMADVRRQFLCFKYRHKDTCSGVEWRGHYQIIKGNCKGLWYLHRNHIVHLDLKPDNILLDDNMVPKIADFGLSKYFRAGLSFQNLDEHQVIWHQNLRLLCFEYIPKGSLYDYITDHIQVRHIQFGCYNHRDTNMTYGIYQRLLCFEYVPKGSFHDYITDASRGLEWRKRYQIIKGICEGLYYLEQKSIIHLDLKPANISMDNNMLPKIADFGLPRCYDENQNWINVSRLSLSKLINGGFAVVYKGILQNGAVAVKKLSNTSYIHDSEFQ